LPTLFSTFVVSTLIVTQHKITIKRTIILPVFYGCKTWSLILKEKCRLTVDDNRVHMNVYEPTRGELGLTINS
jgi:hypothetical protein